MPLGEDRTLLLSEASPEEVLSHLGNLCGLLRRGHGVQEKVSRVQRA
jgi:hypothetical protein